MQGLGLVQDLGFGVRSRELRVFGFLGVQPLQYSTVHEHRELEWVEHDQL